MGIKKGITLIVGGGYHGKSTLLKALELGVYNHIAGDGREYVITDDTAMKIRAEDGRSIKRWIFPCSSTIFRTERIRVPFARRMQWKHLPGCQCGGGHGGGSRDVPHR